MEKRSYSLKELCQVTDVTERTVRFYIQEGLLPPPSGAGPFSRYGYEHWLRLQFIKRLKDEFLPLAEIKNLLTRRSLADLQQLADRSGLLTATNFEAESGNRLESWLAGGSTLRQQMQETASVQETPATYSYRDLSTDNFSPNFGEDEVSAAKADVGETSEKAKKAAPPPPPPASPIQATGRAMRERATGSLGADPHALPKPAAPSGGFLPPVPPSMSAGAPAFGFAAREPAFDVEAFSLSMADSDDFPEAPAATKLDTWQTAVEVGAEAREKETAWPAPPVTPVKDELTETAGTLGEQWEKVSLAPGVELHLEKQVATKHRAVLQQLIEQAKNILKNLD